ncbi:Vacuolar import and degradation protein 27 [Conglomerata obtusa]
MAFSFITSLFKRKETAPSTTTLYINNTPYCTSLPRLTANAIHFTITNIEQPTSPSHKEESSNQTHRPSNKMNTSTYYNKNELILTLAGLSRIRPSGTSSLTFNHDRNMYLLLCDHDITEFVEELRILLAPRHELFLTSGVIYGVYDKRGRYEIKEEMCEVRIVREEMSQAFDTTSSDFNISNEKINSKNNSSDSRNNKKSNTNNIKSYTNYIRIDGSNSMLVHQEEITTDNQFRTDPVKNAFIWSVCYEKVYYTFKIIFKDSVSLLEFVSKYVSCLVKNHSNENGFDGLKGYLKGVKNNIRNDNEFTSSNTNEIGKQTFFDNTSNFSINSSNYNNVNQYNNDDYEGVFESSSDDENKNGYLCIGNDNKAFVSRGGVINVFDVERDRIKHLTNITDINNIAQKNNYFNNLENNKHINSQKQNNAVHKMIQHNDSLLILNDTNAEKLIKMDLNEGRVVEEWDLKRNVNDYFNAKKLHGGNELVGINDYSLFQIDPRVKDKIVLENNYKTKNEFTCGMSTKEGYLAIGSKKGDLRLYDKLDKRAKILLHGYGDEILGVDVTGDGNFVVCTCKSYLLLYIISSWSGKKDGKNINDNIHNNINNDGKPVPIRLQLKNEHLNYINETINFTPAKFSHNNENIVTSTGRFVLSWNLKDILEGRVYDYCIKKCKDIVLADDFGLGSENIVVSTAKEVRVLDRVKMRNPEKEKRRYRE